MIFKSSKQTQYKSFTGAFFETWIANNVLQTARRFLIRADSDRSWNSAGVPPKKVIWKQTWMRKKSSDIFEKVLTDRQENSGENRKCRTIFSSSKFVSVTVSQPLQFCTVPSKESHPGTNLDEEKIVRHFRDFQNSLGDQ